MQTPVTIIGGYLGSGKTTLVNHLLRNANGKRLAILVNEFGELPIDADLIEAQDDDIISLTGGCVCCSYGNDLIMAMIDMAKMDPRPDHIILESSGVALPGAIASSLSLLNDFSIDAIIVLTDAETVRERADDRYMGDTITRQLADADMVLINKTDLVTDEHIKELRSWFEETAADAALVETLKSEVKPEIILGTSAYHPRRMASHENHATGQFETRLLAMDESVDPEAFAQKLVDENPGLVRAKGFTEDLSGTMKTIQVVGKRWEISSAPAGAKRGIVVISVIQ